MAKLIAKTSGKESWAVSGQFHRLGKQDCGNNGQKHCGDEPLAKCDAVAKPRNLREEKREHEKDGDILVRPTKR